MKISHCKLETRYMCSSHNCFERQQECEFFVMAVTRDKCDKMLENKACACFKAISKVRETYFK